MTTKFRTIDSKFTQAQQRRNRAMSTSSVSQTGCILHRKAGTFPPTALLEKILAANPTGWGAASAANDEGHKFVEINADVEPMALDEMEDILKTFPKQDMTFYFCNSPTALSGKDMSPFILVATPAQDDPDEEEAQLVAFVTGNFPAHVKAGSSHPAEYHLAVDVLMPKFQGLYDMVDGDLDKLMLNLMKPHFKKELLLNSVSEGTITLVAANGVVLTFNQGDNQVEGDWGWASNGYGWTAEEAKPVETKKEKKPSIFSRSTVREKHIPEPKEEIKSSAAVAAPKTDTVSIQGYEAVKWKPQASYSRSERKNAYKMRIGFLPEGWEDSVEIDVIKDVKANKLMTFSQVKALGPISIGVQQLMKNPSKVSNVDPNDVKHQQALPIEGGKATTEILPIMSPKSREGVNNIRNKDSYKKIISENAAVIADPKQVEGYETKFADFAAQMGAKSMAEFGSWSFEMWYELCKTDAQAGAVALNTFKNYYLKSNPPQAAKEEVTTGKKPSIFKRSAA